MNWTYFNFIMVTNWQWTCDSRGHLFQKKISTIALLSDCMWHCLQTCNKTYSKPKVTVVAEMWLLSRILGQNKPWTCTDELKFFSVTHHNGLWTEVTCNTQWTCGRNGTVPYTKWPTRFSVMISSLTSCQVSISFIPSIYLLITDFVWLCTDSRFKMVVSPALTIMNQTRYFHFIEFSLPTGIYVVHSVCSLNLILNRL